MPRGNYFSSLSLPHFLLVFFSELMFFSRDGYTIDLFSEGRRIRVFDTG